VLLEVVLHLLMGVLLLAVASARSRAQAQP